MMSDFRKMLDIVSEMSDAPELHDSVEIELGDMVIESGIVQLVEDGVVILVDDIALQHIIDYTKAQLSEAEYQGHKVTLNKPMAGDVKKSKVYVMGPKGKVVKVNFGAKGMRIKKNNPVRRKSFRARHKCENPGPKWKAKYWSCRAW
jgi:hypothetical protein